MTTVSAQHVPREIKALVKRIQRKYPKAGNPHAEDRYVPYSVAGAVVQFHGGKEPYPDEALFTQALLEVNPALAHVCANGEPVAARFARKTLINNNNGYIDNAWAYVTQALAWRFGMKIPDKK